MRYWMFCNKECNAAKTCTAPRHLVLSLPLFFAFSGSLEKSGKTTSANFPRVLAPFNCFASSKVLMSKRLLIVLMASRSISSFLCRYFRVVSIEECPRMPWTIFSGTLSSTNLVARVCPDVIIATTRKNPVFSKAEGLSSVLFPLNFLAQKKSKRRCRKIGCHICDNTFVAV